MRNSFFSKSIRRSSWLLGLSLATVISCSTEEESIDSSELSATNSSLATPSDGKIYTIRSRSNGRTMNIKGKSNSNGANLQVYGTNSTTGATHRQWEVISTGGKYFRLKGVDSGKSLEISGGDNKNGANAQQWEYRGTTHQQWELISTGSGYFRIKNRDSGKSLRVKGSGNGSNVDQASWDGGQNQQWFFTQKGSSSNNGGGSTTPDDDDDDDGGSTGGSGSAAAIISSNFSRDWKLNGFSGSLNVGRGSYGKDGANGLDYKDSASTSDNNNWFFDTNGYAAFKCHVGNPTSNGSGNMRSELRERINGSNAEWDGTTNTNHRMRYKVQIRRMPTSGKLCFGQIHGQGSFDDVIRLQIDDSNANRSATSGKTSGTYDVQIKGYVTEELDRDNRNKSWARISMKREYDVEIAMRNKKVTVKLDGKTIYTSKDVNSKDNYFKAGAYLQSSQSDKDPQLKRNNNNFGEVWIKNMVVNH